ncbi:sulfatase-like hydrolase/transferase (plasmid) [Catenovulum adriaticum]|uniref:Sulfatase-like hydrolase/transferase n=1 Tax=Catenovulum adriaticum TaxID=2984846 RepID=A0ABY7AQW3_9ALTE|nr:sulfatase-like hydrolase/transferase [Catenovulum sp. TS8]WAJ71874.1 sulfatase-like hydrolase/transferase [Catenovulum sp. TS8]
MKILTLSKIAKLSVVALAINLTACSEKPAEQTSIKTSNENKPNVVIFYVDDLGYGDVGVYGAKGVETPNIDKLAKNGIQFTDAHSSAATCTPSRYSLLTGEHAFRKNASVLKGDAAMIISTEQPTLPKMLAKVGYETAVVGKWHLGLGDGSKPIDWNDAIKPGPLEIGFDYSFLLPATGDRVPTVYLENHHVLNLDSNDPLSVDYTQKIGNRPTGYENPELERQSADHQHNKTLINGIGRIGWMAGGKSAEWVDEDFYQVFTNKANDFIKQNKDNPFFLFFSFHDIHVPRLPNEKFQGKSSMGVRGDAIVQMDWITGQVVDELEKQGVLDNTLIIFTSDNGPVLNDGYDDQAIELLGDHKPGGIYRGGKYSAYEAGTRVPTIMHYPAKVKPGVSDALMSQIDVYASVASMLNIELSNDEAIDSENQADAWLNADAKGREELIEEAYTLSLRQGDWKYIAPSQNANEWVTNLKGIEPGTQPQPQLYNLKLDPTESNNVAEQNPEIVNALKQRLNELKNKSSRT